MAETFKYDVFLSHSSKDKDIVRDIAERLKKDNIKVWFDEWEIKPGDSIPSKIEEGLENSRVLVLCMSANAFGSDWAQLESHTFRFRDPLNKDRRFVPVRLDHARLPVTLARYRCINWAARADRQQFEGLLESCRPQRSRTTRRWVTNQVKSVGEFPRLKGPNRIFSYDVSPSGGLVLTGDSDSMVRLWETGTGKCILRLDGHSRGNPNYSTGVWRVAMNSDQNIAVSGGCDGTVRVWDLKSGKCTHVFQENTDAVQSLEFYRGDTVLMTGANDGTVRLWDITDGSSAIIKQLSHPVRTCLNRMKNKVLLSGETSRIICWDLANDLILDDVEVGHEEAWYSAWTENDTGFLVGNRDGSLSQWDLDTGKCVRVLEGHENQILEVIQCLGTPFALTGSMDRTVGLWDVQSGMLVQRLYGHKAPVIFLRWNEAGQFAFSGDEFGRLRKWDLSKLLRTATTPQKSSRFKVAHEGQIEYTNAKVLLVGDSSSGKTGLSMRIATDNWQPSDSTVGAWAQQWKLPVSSGLRVEREIWLWDFGGQSDQRLIHQLYMEDTALAVLVFDGQKDNVFEGIGQWDRELERASNRTFVKILAVGRVDAGGLRVSKKDLEEFARERGYLKLFETSAKQNIGCVELKEAIVEGIKWEDIPWRSSPIIFKQLKDEILRLKDEGRVLMRLNELRDALRLNISSSGANFTDDELRAVVRLLAGPGVVWEFAFGSLVLLQPEMINAYAQAVIQTIRSDDDQRGCIQEDRVLNGELAYQSSTQRLEKEEERFVLLAMHQILVKRGLCLRENTDKGPMLIFPSYYRRERPELEGHPAVLLNYRFVGFLDDVYATLVVRLHHTGPFRQDRLWRYAADFRTLTEKQLGIKLTRRPEGAGELEVYFDSSISMQEKIIFSRYVHEHLLQRGQEVVRLRHYVCPYCGTPVGNREVAMKRLEEWLENTKSDARAGNRLAHSGKIETPTIICTNCEKRVPLWDDLEQCFASPEIRDRVRELQEESAIVLDGESKERALVGEVISTVALAAQICRELNVSDQGIDMEIEFKNDDQEATGRKLYLQLKSGDSYLRQRMRDNAEVFTIKDERHARYWAQQAFPVLLVIRNSEGNVRWMRIDDYLRSEGASGNPVKQIVFDGECFDVMSIRRWRKKLLGDSVTP